MKPKSLRSRMTATFALTFAALILVFNGFILWYARHTAERNADATLQLAANKIRGEYAEIRPNEDNFGWADEPGEWTQQNLALVIVDARGDIRFKTPGRVPAWPRPDQREWRIQTVALGEKTAVLGYHWRKIETTLRTQAVMLIGLCLTLLLAATFGAWLLVGRTLSPIYALSRQADAASLESLRVHLTAPSQDTEIAHLVGTLNALLERLAGAISARERFYAAASHELRTPLQTLKGFLELALMRERGAEEYRAALAEAYAQSERLTALVQALLLLNQLEATPAREKQTVNLSEACDRWMEEFTPLAKSRRLRFAACPSETVHVQAASTHVDILLRNLVENAVKYAATDSEIQVCIRVSPKETALTIFNRCSPVPEWNEAKLFEPFYRPDASRNSDTGGNGLGLAICKAVALANGWGLTLRQEESGVLAKVIFR
jgi:signal transduction histidine kinase